MNGETILLIRRNCPNGGFSLKRKSKRRKKRNGKEFRNERKNIVRLYRKRGYPKMLDIKMSEK